MRDLSSPDSLMNGRLPFKFLPGSVIALSFLPRLAYNDLCLDALAAYLMDPFLGLNIGLCSTPRTFYCLDSVENRSIFGTGSHLLVDTWIPNA